MSTEELKGAARLLLETTLSTTIELATRQLRDDPPKTASEFRLVAEIFEQAAQAVELLEADEVARATERYRQLLSEVATMDPVDLREIQSVAHRWLSTAISYQEAKAEVERFVARARSQRDPKKRPGA